MADENEVVLLKYFLEKFRSHNFENVGFLNRKNVIIGETYDWRGKGIEFFPRIEILLTHFGGDGEVSNITRDESWIFQTACYLYNSDLDLEEENYFDLINFGKKVKKLVYSAHSDRIAGNLPCPNFIQISGFPQVDIEGELYKHVIGNILQFTVQVSEENIY